MKTAFFGSSNFSIPFLEIVKEKTDLRLVVSTEDQPKGRGQKIISNPVKCVAQDADIRVLTPADLRDNTFLNAFREQQFDYVITASYGKILPVDLLSLAKFGFFNIHPSLLPAYRGAEPLFWQIAHGIKESGVTLFRMSTGLDSGDIVEQATFPILENDNYAAVELNAIRFGLQLLKKMIDTLERNQPLQVRSQASGHKPLFYARKMTYKDEEIHWKMPAESIHNLIRAFSPHIGAFTFYQGKRVKIMESRKTNQLSEGFPGSIVVQGKKLYVTTNDYLLKIETLKPEGKNMIRSEDFMNGYLNKDNYPVFTSMVDR